MRLDDQLRSAFDKFALRLQGDAAPVGRESELKSLFAFGPLLASIDREGDLFDPRQIGIEIAVPQRPSNKGQRLKKLVCKDLVIWSKPEMTCWGPTGTERLFPRAVLEWKSVTRWGRSSIATRGQKYDHDWLSWFVGASPDSEGYSVLVSIDGTGWTVRVDRFTAAGCEPGWFATPMSNLPLQSDGASRRR